MAAPAGVSSEPAPEPDAPKAAATEPVALEPADPEPSGPAGGERAADPEPGGPAGDTRPGAPGGVSWLVTAGVVVVVLALPRPQAPWLRDDPRLPAQDRSVTTGRPPYSACGQAIASIPHRTGSRSRVLSCATPHEAEVFATFGLTGSGWPGAATIQQQASNGCSERIAGYLNPELLNAGLTEQYVYPDQKAWQAGVRTVVCEVSSSTGPLTGSVRTAG